MAARGPSGLGLPASSLASLAVWAPLALILLSASVVHGSVFLITRQNVSFPFEDADAAFGGIILPMGIQGILRRAVPYDACTPFDQVVEPGTEVPQFALIERGSCEFDRKVLNAQLAGYSAAVIYDHEDSTDLITMSGRHLWDVYIPAVFVTRRSGHQMLSIIEQMETVCVITPAFDNTAWSIMTASFLSLLALCSVMTLFLYVRRARLRELAVRMLEPEPMGMSDREVKALPELVFQEGMAEESRGLETCAICLDDFEQQDRLRVLPCRHGFHVACIDQWLTTRSPCCPVCKRDCRADAAGPSGPTASISSRGEANEEEEGEEQELEHEEGDEQQLGRFGARASRFLRELQALVLPIRSSLSSVIVRQGTLGDPLLPIVVPPTEPIEPPQEAPDEPQQQQQQQQQEQEQEHEEGDEGMQQLQGQPLQSQRLPQLLGRDDVAEVPHTLRLPSEGRRAGGIPMSGLSIEEENSPV